MPLRIVAPLGLFLGWCLLGCVAKSHAKDEVVERIKTLAKRLERIGAGNEVVKLEESEAKLFSDDLTDRDRMAFKAVMDFGKTVRDEDLDTVVQFSLSSEDSRTVRWPMAWLLVERKRLDAAAQIIVLDLVKNTENRSYKMWKWWAVVFGIREDFKILSCDFRAALLRKFDSGDPDSKLVVSELFGKGAAEAKLGLAEFKAAIRYEDKKPVEQPMSEKEKIEALLKKEELKKLEEPPKEKEKEKP